MINDPSQIIEHNSYWTLPGLVIWGNYRSQQLYDAPPDGAQVVLTIDDAARFFNMWGGVNRNYTLISSSSDFSLALQEECSQNFFMQNGCNPSHKYCARSYNAIWYSFPEIPSNIVHWFMTHPLLENERISAIPFGISEKGTGDLWTVMLENHTKRPNSIYANFSVDSNPIDREPVLRACKAWKDAGFDVTIDAPNLSRLDFYRAVAQHEYCVCPKGNGEDSYRIWESLYLKTKPIINKDRRSVWQHKLGLSSYDITLDIEQCNDAFYYERNPLHGMGYYLDTELLEDLLNLSFWEKCFNET
jgi:hypothetical protein